MTEKSNPLLNRIFELFVSMRFSITLLALVGAGCILGTFIKQGGTEGEYLALYAENTYRIIKLFGLDDVYHSAWFYVLVGTFGVCLVLCSARRLLRLLTEKKPNDLPAPGRLRFMECNALVPAERWVETTRGIRRTYKLVQENENGMVFEKGKISRWGVFVTHSSVVVILAGAFMGFLLGFRGFMALVPGETKDRIATKNAGHDARMLDFAVRCKDFKASLYTNGTPKDYVSTVEIIENNKVLAEKNIRVNEPLYYRGTYIYQSGYGQRNTFVFSIDGQKMALGEEETVEKGKLLLMVAGVRNEIPGFGPGVQVVFFDGNETKATWFLPDVKRLRSQRIRGVNVELVDIQENLYTNLEVAKDPGIPVVWIGFCLLLFGLYLTFFTSYRKIFVVLTDNGIVVAGYALKNNEMFRKEFEKLTKGAVDNAR
jgi:cytochrome c biogenesis protein